MHHEPRGHYRWVVLAVGTLAVFGALGLARFGYTVVLPAMQTGLRMGNTEAGFLASLNLAGYLALAAGGGALASRFGPRIVIAAGLCLAGGGMLLTGLASGFTEAALWRCITGMGSGAANVSVMGMWATWFGVKRRGFASGIAVTGSSLALIIAGPLAPQIISRYGADGWRVCWFVFGLTTLALALLCLGVIRNRRPEPEIDLATAYAGTPQKQEKLSWSLVYRSGPVWRLGLVYVAFGFSYMIYMTFFVKRLVAEGGYTRAEAGSLFMTMGWVSLLCGLVWGTVSDVIGRKWTLVIVYLIHAAAFGIFALWPTAPGFTLSAILFGLSAWSIPAIMAAACGDVLGPRLAPAALGFITVFFGMGQAAGPGIAGWIADAAGSFAPAYLLASGVALVGAVGAALLKATHHPGHP